MAFKQIKRGGNAVSLDKKNKTAQGFLLGLEFPKKSKFKDSFIVRLRGEDGTPVNVWGTAQIAQSLCDSTGKAVESAFAGKLVRLTFAGEKKLPGRKQKMKEITVEVDPDKALPGRGKSGKDYQLNPAKTLAK